MSKLIIGLGNPGQQYKNNRHNVGFKVIDSLSKKMGIVLDKKQFNGEYGVFMHENEKYVIAKPLTYMNLSGDFVVKFIQYYNVNISDVIIIYDDVDTRLGEIRLRTSGSSGGQNGIKDIIEKLGTDAFKRIKIGIGPKPSNINLVNYVLDNFSANNLVVIAKVINLVNDMILNLNKTDFSNLLDYVRKTK